MDQYAWNEQNDREYIEMVVAILPENLRNRDFSLVVGNCRNMAFRYVDLGILHWRHGLDPRSDFEGAIKTYETMRAIAQEHAMVERVGSIDLLYAAMFLMDRKVDLEFRDDRHNLARWPRYENYISHVLHDRQIDQGLSRWVDKGLSENTGLIDRTFLVYLQLLGHRPAGISRDELVRRAEANWLKRKTSKSFEDGDARDGFGVMNDLYVDIYLAAVLKKIGWHGESFHKWIWN